LTDIEWYLINWARYMRSGESPATLPKASLGIQGFTHEDTDGAYDRADLTAAMATDASIADLSVAEQAAIHHTYLNAVYRFPRGNYDEILASATLHVQQSLERKGVFVQILDFVEK
jgi:hypothetical protein